MFSSVPGGPAETGVPFLLHLHASVPTQLPQCTFAPREIGASLIRGAKQLDKYGPLHFEIMYAVAAGLGGDFLKVCKVKTPAQVDQVLLETVVRWA